MDELLVANAQYAVLVVDAAWAAVATKAPRVETTAVQLRKVQVEAQRAVTAARHLREMLQRHLTLVLTLSLSLGSVVSMNARSGIRSALRACDAGDFALCHTPRCVAELSVGMMCWVVT